ncbi:hypothetical protein ACFQH6_18285 [Halobacteriaceae archaeon GCM10025711]
MRRRTYLALAGTGSFGLLSGCTLLRDRDGGLQNGSFESGLDGWTVGHDLPTDPNTGDLVATDASVTGTRAAAGTRSLELFIDGRQDDGTLWVQQPALLSDVQTLSVAVFSPAESFNVLTRIAAYAGPEPMGGLTETQFDTRRAVEDHVGWRTHEYPVEFDGEGVVAVGVSVVWETEVTRWLDDVRLL